VRHGGFLGQVYQKERNKKTYDGVFLGTLGTFQNGIFGSFFKKISNFTTNFYEYF
jgi:hypothetical protein